MLAQAAAAPSGWPPKVKPSRRVPAGEVVDAGELHGHVHRFRSAAGEEALLQVAGRDFRQEVGELQRWLVQEAAGHGLGRDDG